ncbi:hypothetical protein [Yoonia sp.]|uniref:hypothetical protein n=1 Tax=Yoonia sp. TaxID=2212373 RepID=UPI0025FC688F|nr:hypothetical protein [Yoonia sp.]
MWKFILIPLIVMAGMADAESVTTTNGTDTFTAGSTIMQSYNATGDVFVAGDVVTTAGQAGGDVHVAGMDVDFNTATDADLYAIGATVTIRANVAQDVTAIAYSVRLAPEAAVGGNARLAGRAVIIDGPIAGALSVAAGEVTLNGTIAGDARITAETISFGPDAKILGLLTYASEEQMRIPERVIPADRVRHETLDSGRMWDEINRTWDKAEMPMMPTFMSLFGFFLITLAFFVLIGSIFLTFTPKIIASMRREVADRPGHIFLLGILGLSMLFGLVPITALTIVGLPFVPFAILLILLAWTLGYVLAAYAIAMRVMALLGGAEHPPLLIRLLILVVAVCIVTLLNFIPFVGWIINYTLVLLGIGAMTSALFNWLIGNPGYAFDVDMKPITPQEPTTGA